MGLLDDVLNNDEVKGQFGDFVDRFTDGSPTDDKISEQEAEQRYGEVKGQLDRDEYVASAHETLDRMSPAERAEVGKELRGAADHQGIDVSEQGDDADGIAGIIGKLMDGGVDLDSILRNLPGGLSKGMLGGIAAMAAKKFLS